MPLFFLLWEAMVTQNEHIRPQRAGDSLIQYIQYELFLWVLLVFLNPLFLRLVDEYHVAEGVSSWSGDISLLLTHSDHPSSFMLLPLT